MNLLTKWKSLFRLLTDDKMFILNRYVYGLLKVKNSGDRWIIKKLSGRQFNRKFIDFGEILANCEPRLIVTV